MRGLAAAAVWASAVAAGTIASSNGSPTAAPIPLRTVRRLMCFLVMNIALPSILDNAQSAAPDGRGAQRRVIAHCDLLLNGSLTIRRPLHLEGVRVDDAQNDRGQAIVLSARGAHDGPHGRHVVILQRSPQRECQQIL